MSRIRPAQPGDPSRLGPFRIIGRLGSGGMGTVHAALTANGSRVALKVIHAAQAGDPEFRARFRREVELSRRVQGPCLVPLLDADPDSDTPWLATEYVPGPTLAEYITVHGPLTGARLYALAAGSAAALTAIHQAGVVHRDIKPGNVILAPDAPRVLDFGIAHALDGTSVTRTGVMTGTPGWISPELYRAGISGPEGDVFAWGALIAYAASGRLPFGSGAPDVVAFRVISGHPDVADVPDDLLTLVRKALAKEPAERPTASTLATECTALISSQSTHALTRGTQSTTTLVADLVAAQWDLPTLDDTAWTAAPRLTTRRRAFLLAAAGIATFTVAAGGSYTVLGHGVYRADSPTSVAAPSGSIRTAVPPSASPAVSTEAPLAASAKTDSASPTAPPADPQPAFTRADKTQPSLDEWAEARDSMTPAERDMTAAINRDLGDYLRQDYGLEGAQVTFNPAAQTMFVTVGPSITVSNNGGDYTDLIRSVMFAGCSYGNEELKTNITWPYGRVAVVYRESMAHPIIADHRVVTNSMYCRV